MEMLAKIFLHPDGHEIGHNSGMWPEKPATTKVNTHFLHDMRIKAKRTIALNDCNDEPNYDILDCIKRHQEFRLQNQSGMEEVNGTNGNDCKGQQICYVPNLSVYLNSTNTTHCETKHAMVCTLRYFSKFVLSLQLGYITNEISQCLWTITPEDYLQ